MNKNKYLALAIIAISIGLSSGQEYRQGQYPSKTQLYGLSYSPYALDADNICLSTDEVLKDMEILASHADHLRTYNLAECLENTYTMLNFCKNNGIRVVLGLFFADDETRNEAELSNLPNVIEEYGDIIDAILFGNEALFLELIEYRYLIEYLNRGKELIRNSTYPAIPVSVAEVWPVYESDAGIELIKELDFICMNMQPYWEGFDVTCPTDIDYECADAGEYVNLKADGLESFFGKPVWACESGWPTEGERCCSGRPFAIDGLRAGPSEANATKFMSDLVRTSRERNRPTFLFETIDGDWKRIWSPCGTCEGLSTGVDNPDCNTCELDYHFGFYTYDRIKKDGIIIPDAP